MKIVEWESCSQQEQNWVLQRPQQQAREELFSQVNNIIADVKRSGDYACYQLTAKYDGVKISSLCIPQEAIENATVNAEVAQAMAIAVKTISTMQRALLPTDKIVETFPGVVCQRIAQPLDVVGLYVPGGSAPLVSTLMMLALPAKIAGCRKIIMCTPPNKMGKVDPIILYAAKLCGVSQLYTLGGAQAIVAMAYGTETIPKVTKIFGPGNAWVTAAKQIVAQDPLGASCDLPAGPSELMIIADETARAEIIAADLLSQAEHGPDSQVILCTTSRELAQQVKQDLNTQLKRLPRKNIAESALKNGWIVVVDKIADAINIANLYAAEHLSLQCENPRQWVDQIRNTGAVFVGENTAETFGDYITGSNHVLPTYGYSRVFSGLSVADFMRFTTIQSVDDKALQQLAAAAMTLAELEGLSGHANAVKIRLAQQEIKSC